jgi:hypothetical protein
MAHQDQPRVVELGSPGVLHQVGLPAVVRPEARHRCGGELRGQGGLQLAGLVVAQATHNQNERAGWLGGGGRGARLAARNRQKQRKRDCEKQGKFRIFRGLFRKHIVFLDLGAKIYLQELLLFICNPARDLA